MNESLMVHDFDSHYMNLAFELAEYGRGKTSPNPMVGALVVRDGMIFGKGFHEKAGSDHAEILALREAGEKARGGTLYVTLEPCCHHGKTPPCTDAILHSGIKRVVAAMTDLNPLVSGGGFSRLRESGIAVTNGLYQNKALKLNEVYCKYITKSIPYIVVKLALTLDGKIADNSGTSKWITGPDARKHVHKLRSWYDAVMVGIGTVLADDPLLTVREVHGDDPIRIIVDTHLRIPLNARVLHDTKVIIVTSDDIEERKSKRLIERGIELLRIPSHNNRISLPEMVKQLGERDITSILCEGGGTLASSLFNERLADKAIFFFSPKILGNGLNGIQGPSLRKLDTAIRLKDMECTWFGEDMMVSGYPVY